jgi:hypothetical protein
MLADPAANDSPSSSRALVIAAGPEQSAQRHRPVQRAAAFVTHLIATARQVPQARARRRADPAEVIAAYRTTIARLQRPNCQ